jgi:hypothetical protein
MHPETLLTALRQQPFVPFRLHMVDGKTVYEIRHPENLMVGKREAIVGVRKQHNSTVFHDYHEVLALLHVMRIEPLVSSDQPSAA